MTWEKSSDIASFVYMEHHPLVYSIEILEILGASRKNSDITSFVENPVYSISKMYTVLILVILFWFVTIYPKSISKRHLFSKF